jgi:hypothetical protein
MKKNKILDALVLGDEPIPAAVLKQSMFFYKTALLMLAFGCGFSIMNKEWLGILASMFLAGIIAFFGFTMSLRASKSGTEVMRGKCVRFERHPLYTSLSPTWVYVEPEDKDRFPGKLYRFPYRIDKQKSKAISAANNDYDEDVQIGDTVDVTIAKTTEFVDKEGFMACYDGFYGYEKVFANDEELTEEEPASEQE